MSRLRGWPLFITLLAWYALFRLGLAKRPEPWHTHYDPGLTFLGRLFGWWRELSVVGAEHCPQEGPTVFAGNHFRLDDPFVTACAIHLAGERKVRLNSLMRDDYFDTFPRWLVWLVRPDILCDILGAVAVTRRSAGNTQLAPLIEVLGRGGAFMIYPGRSRSRNGQFIQYRDWIQSPGRTSLFLSQAQERYPGLKVSAVPAIRTYNPATKRSTVVFGAAHHLEPGAGHEEQRAFDHGLVVAMSDLVCVNVPQVLGALLYLRCLHARPARIAMSALTAQVMEVFARLDGRRVESAAIADTAREVKRTIRLFQSCRLLKGRGGEVVVDSGAILAEPPGNPKLMRVNPAKYCANQIMHLADVVSAIERAALDGRDV
ncbi:MAG: hypothetical protein GWP08_14915 [Nitrospiraceae bacterium]|nr:hypothetical protein [Nitrospiraceae bacterium]